MNEPEPSPLFPMAGRAPTTSTKRHPEDTVSHLVAPLDVPTGREGSEA